MEISITQEQADIIADALFSYKCEIKSRMEQCVTSEKERKSENAIIHEIENVLLPILGVD